MYKGVSMSLNPYESLAGVLGTPLTNDIRRKADIKIFY
jgi:hypothetical protein